jgi:hypothetical protein
MAWMPRSIPAFLWKTPGDFVAAAFFSFIPSLTKVANLARCGQSFAINATPACEE